MDPTDYPMGHRIDSSGGCDERVDEMSDPRACADIKHS